MAAPSNLDILRVARWVIAPTRASAAAYAAATAVGVAAAVIAAQNQARLAAALAPALAGASASANLVALALWSAVAAAAAAARGAVFTALHQRMYARLAAAVFGRVRAADMTVWDVEWRESDRAQTVMSAVSDVHETISAATLLVNVTLRNAATAVYVVVAWRAAAAPHLLWVGLAACAAHLALAAAVHPWNQRAGDAARAAKQEGEAVMQEFVQKHTGVLLCAWQGVYGCLAAAAATNYAARGNAEVAAYAAAIAAGQLFPRLGELAVVAALTSVYVGAEVGVGAETAIAVAAYTRTIEAVAYYHVLTGAVNECKDQWVSTWRQRVAIARIWQILQRPEPAGADLQAEDHSEPQAQIGPVIAFENVTFTYPTAGAPVLRDFSLAVQPGELVVLRGKSGRGKTTLLKLLLGLYAPDAGAVTLCGRSPRASGRPRADLRRLIAVSPQDPLYFPQQTLRENIEMGLFACSQASEQANKQASEQASERALARAGLGELAGRLDARVVELSGGQRQRLAVARVLLNRDQPVVVLDEPTAALDDETAAEVVAALAAHLAETGAAAIWITHQHQVVPPHPRIRTVHL